MLNNIWYDYFLWIFNGTYWTRDKCWYIICLHSGQKSLWYFYINLHLLFSSSKCRKWQLNHKFTLLFKTNKLKSLLSLLKSGTCFTFIYASVGLETELRSHFGQTQNAIHYNISSSHHYFLNWILKYNYKIAIYLSHSCCKTLYDSLVRGSRGLMVRE